MTNSRAKLPILKAEAVTIVTGVVTLSPGYGKLSIGGEGATNDSLDTINGGIDGQLLVCSAISASQDITFTQSGNLELVGTTFLTVDSKDQILFRKSGASWIEISRSVNS